jgi:hypothetical protein
MPGSLGLFRIRHGLASAVMANTAICTCSASTAGCVTTAAVGGGVAQHDPLIHPRPAPLSSELPDQDLVVIAEDDQRAGALGDALP